eukprot:TRINITY_DN1812_c0_g1_i8.p1 TRINITY_DN1812_c0_g1~~TRINITY_DN1812_c0_g1_i8.p1  ORF type:complete len:111 (+),score=41.93 TRINITY_DN1812_c0_g1_i8:71-403(+)
MYHTYYVIICCFFFFFKQKTAYEMLRSLVGSEMCIRDRSKIIGGGDGSGNGDQSVRLSFGWLMLAVFLLAAEVVIDLNDWAAAPEHAQKPEQVKQEVEESLHKRQQTNNV